MFNAVKRLIPAPIKNVLRRLLAWLRAGRRDMQSSEAYWTRCNVTRHHKFKSVQESLAYLDWRNRQYLGYIELMPVAGHNGKVVLDYGCGPGHDTVGFAQFSRPARLIAMDVSLPSLDEARQRLALHGFNAEYLHISENAERLPLEDDSIDLIHCSGVLHHIADPKRILREFARVLRPEGSAQIMVYNYDSIFMHLYTAYQKMIVERAYGGLTLRQAFAKLTDGEECPVSACYKPTEFIAMTESAGFKCELTGCAISMLEMRLLPLRFEAISNHRLPPETCAFLYDLAFDEKNRPLYGGQVAGVDACYRLRL